MSATGLACITGGKYRITYSEGEAIAAFVPPPALLDIDWQSLKPAHRRLLEEFDKHWQIIAHWLVFFRTGAVDIKQEPFTFLEFQDKRPLAELYSSQLDLCKAAWEAIEIRHHYPTPFHWWKSCMVELQQSQVNSILASGYEKNNLSKGKLESGLRKFINDLKDERIPFSQSPKNQHLFRLYNAALRQKPNKAVKKAWNDYLSNLNLYTRHVKTSNCKVIVHLANSLYYQGEKNHLTPIRYTQVAEITLPPFCTENCR